MLTPEAAEGLWRPYDFTSPEMLSELQRRLLDGGFETFARQFGMQLTAKTRLNFEADYVRFQIVPFGALESTVAPGDAVIAATLEGSEARLIYALPTTEALTWALRMVGGTTTWRGEIRSLTAVERALVWRLADEHIAELQIALGGLLPAFAVDSLAYQLTPGLAQPDELMIAVSFRLNRPGDQIALTIAIPADPVLKALGHGVIEKPGRDVERKLRAHVVDAPVEMALQFDETRVGPSIVLSLVEGDLIPLAHPRHRPLSVTLDGDRIARAAVGANGGRLACVVVDYEEAS